MSRKFVKSLTKCDINFALDCLWRRIGELEEELASLKEFDVGANTAEVFVPRDEFDWERSEDLDALKEYAESKGVEFDARATPKSLKQKIEEHNLGEK